MYRKEQVSYATERESILLPASISRVDNEQ